MKNSKWILAGFTFLFLGVLLVHYVRPVFSQTNKPAIEWVVGKGDEEVIQNLRISGYFFNQGGDFNDVEISLNRTDSQKHPLFYSYYTEQPVVIENLQNRFPSYMRGKDHFPTNFAESANHVFYVGDYNYYLKDSEPKQSFVLPLAVLEKSTGSESEEELLIEASFPLYNAYVQNIVVTDAYLIIDLIFSGASDNASSIYVYDWKNKEIVTQFENQLTDGARYGSEIENFILDEAAGQLFTIETIHIYPEFVEDETAEIHPEIQRYYTLYDIESDEVQEVELPDEFDDNEEGHFFTKDGHIYFIRYENDAYLILAYDLASQSIVKEKSIPVGEAFADEGQYFYMQPWNEHLFIIEPVMNDEKNKLGFLMLDLTSLEVLAEGYLEENSDIEFYVEKIYFE